MDNRKKISRKGILLSVIALIEILLITVTMAYSWIESSSSLKVTGKDITTVGRPVSQAVIMEAAVDNYEGAVDLNNVINDFIDQQDSFLIGKTSSVDGKTFYFDTGNRLGVNTIYRKGTVNDINVNYISFDFTVKATEAIDIWFDGIPTLAINGGAANSAKAIRFSISDGTTTRIFKNNTDGVNAISALNVSGTVKTRAPQTVHQYSEYVFDASAEDISANALFSLNSGEEKTLAVNIWLESEDPACVTNQLAGATLDMDIKLCTSWSKTTAVNFTDRTVSNEGAKNIIANGNYDIYAVNNDNGNTVKYYYKLTKTADSNKWQGQVPYAMMDKIRFIACPAGSKTITYMFPAAELSRGDSINFTALYSYGSTSGHGTWETVQEITFDYTMRYQIPALVRVGMDSGSYFYPLYKDSTTGTSVKYKGYIPASKTNMVFRTYNSTANGASDYKLSWNATSRGTSTTYTAYAPMPNNDVAAAGTWGYGKIRLFFQDKFDWSDVKIYYWGSSHESIVWGEAKTMLYAGKSSDNYHMKYYDIPADVTGVIIFKGLDSSWRTGDIASAADLVNRRSFYPTNATGSGFGAYNIEEVPYNLYF